MKLNSSLKKINEAAGRSEEEKEEEE